MISRVPEESFCLVIAAPPPKGGPPPLPLPDLYFPLFKPEINSHSCRLANQLAFRTLPPPPPPSLRRFARIDVRLRSLGRMV